MNPSEKAVMGTNLRSFNGMFGAKSNAQHPEAAANSD
jgi:hypothetical protein